MPIFLGYWVVLYVTKHYFGSQMTNKYAELEFAITTTNITAAKRRLESLIPVLNVIKASKLILCLTNTCNKVLGQFPVQFHGEKLFDAFAMTHCPYFVYGLFGY